MQLEPNERLRVLVVDDQRMFRDMLARELAREPDLDIVGTISDPTDLSRIAEDLRPDVVLMNVHLAGRTSCDAADRLRHSLPDVVIIFLADFYADTMIERALHVSASGYLSKSESYELLLDAIRKGAAGETTVPDAVRSRFLAGDGNSTRRSTLTHREQEVLELIAQGLAKKQIASAMGVSIKTIESHTSKLMKKLDIHDRVELTRFAIREGLVPV